MIERLTPLSPEAEISTETKTTIAKIAIGDIVHIQYDGDPDSEPYRLIEIHDDDPDSPIRAVSINTPLSIAVRGAQEGDTVIVKSPNGDVPVVIRKVVRAASSG